MTHLLSRVGLLVGNFVVGVTVLAPAGMLDGLSQGLQVSIQDAGLLVTYGAIVLCLGSPIMAWLTTRIDRKVLLLTALAIVSLGQLLSALSPNYLSVLGIRLFVLVFAAIYTPQAASTVALIVPERERPGAIAFVFLGWALAFAAGLPLITFLTATLGWRGTFGAMAFAGVLSLALLVPALPRGLHGQPLSLRSFAELARHRPILLILLVSLLSNAGQLTILIYLAPLVGALTDAGTAVAGTFFAVFGVASLIGNIAGTRLVRPLGARQTFVATLGLVIAGIALWVCGAGSVVAMGIGVAIWGLGFASGNSMQQARLNAAAPHLASVSIAFNTSVIYVGQAIGSALGGWLFVHGQAQAAGYAALAFTMAAAVVLALSRNQTPNGA